LTRARERERERNGQAGGAGEAWDGRNLYNGGFFLVDTIEDNEVMYYFPSV
jgi:hypothetical protein